MPHGRAGWGAGGVWDCFAATTLEAHPAGLATRPYTVGRVVDCFVGLSRHLPQEGGFAEMPVERSGKLVCLAFGNVAAYTLQDL